MFTSFRSPHYLSFWSELPVRLSFHTAICQYAERFPLRHSYLECKRLPKSVRNTVGSNQHRSKTHRLCQNKFVQPNIELRVSFLHLGSFKRACYFFRYWKQVFKINILHVPILKELRTPGLNVFASIFITFFFTLIFDSTTNASKSPFLLKTETERKHRNTDIF
jgi:hypothetical protein